MYLAQWSTYIVDEVFERGDLTFLQGGTRPLSRPADTLSMPPSATAERSSTPNTSEIQIPDERIANTSRNTNMETEEAQLILSQSILLTNLLPPLFPFSLHVIQ